MTTYILNDEDYIFNPQTKTITLLSSFNTLSIAHIIHVKNITTQELIYDGEIFNTAPESRIISYNSGVMKYTIDSVFSKPTDKLRIKVDIGSIIYSKDLTPK